MQTKAKRQKVCPPKVASNKHLNNWPVGPFVCAIYVSCRYLCHNFYLILSNFLHAIRDCMHRSAKNKKSSKSSKIRHYSTLRKIISPSACTTSSKVANQIRDGCFSIFQKQHRLIYKFLWFMPITLPQPVLAE